MPLLLPSYPLNCQCLWKKTLIEKTWLIFLHANINPFVPNAPFLYSLKTSENLTVFWCIHEVEKRCIGNKWIKKKERITPFSWRRLGVFIINSEQTSFVAPVFPLLLIWTRKCWWVIAKHLNTCFVNIHFSFAKNASI